MGWGRFFLLGDWGQQMDLRDQARTLEEVRHAQVSQAHRDQTQDGRIEALEEEVARLRQYIGTLCQLLRDKGVVAESELDRAAGAVYGEPPSLSDD